MFCIKTPHFRMQGGHWSKRRLIGDSRPPCGPLRPAKVIHSKGTPGIFRNCDQDKIPGTECKVFHLKLAVVKTSDHGNCRTNQLPPSRAGRGQQWTKHPPHRPQWWLLCYSFHTASNRIVKGPASTAQLLGHIWAFNPLSWSDSTLRIQSQAQVFVLSWRRWCGSCCARG